MITAAKGDVAGVNYAPASRSGSRRLTPFPDFADQIHLDRRHRRPHAPLPNSSPTSFSRTPHTRHIARLRPLWIENCRRRRRGPLRLALPSVAQREGRPSGSVEEGCRGTHWEHRFAGSWGYVGRVRRRSAPRNAPLSRALSYQVCGFTDPLLNHTLPPLALPNLSDRSPITALTRLEALSRVLSRILRTPTSERTGAVDIPVGALVELGVRLVGMNSEMPVRLNEPYLSRLFAVADETPRWLPGQGARRPDDPHPFHVAPPQASGGRMPYSCSTRLVVSSFPLPFCPSATPELLSQQRRTSVGRERSRSSRGHLSDSSYLSAEVVSDHSWYFAQRRLADLKCCPVRCDLPSRRRSRWSSSRWAPPLTRRRGRRVSRVFGGQSWRISELSRSSLWSWPSPTFVLSL